MRFIRWSALTKSPTPTRPERIQLQVPQNTVPKGLVQIARIDVAGVSPIKLLMRWPGAPRDHG